MTKFVGTPLRGIEFANLGDEALSVRIVGDSHSRLRIDAGGRLTWSSGDATGDTVLYRDAANALITDDTFEASSGIITLTTNGVPTSALPNGAIAIDTTNDRFYFRSDNAWQAVEGGATVSGTAPSNPITGALWYNSSTQELSIYDGSAWVVASGGSASVVVGDTAPSSPSSGDLWFESDTLKFFIYYDGAWIEIGGGGAGGGASVEVSDTPPTSPEEGDMWFESDTGSFYVYYDNVWAEIGGGSLNYLSGLLDVSITSPTSGQVLKYNGTAWVNDTDDAGTTITSLDDIGDVTITTATNGDFLRWNGTAWVNDAVNLSTDTIGDYVESLVAGTGISVTNNDGEAATPTVSLDANLEDISDVVLTSTTNGDLIQFDGTNWVNVASSSVGATDLDGLSDVSIFQPANGQFLQYTQFGWVNGTMPTDEPTGFVLQSDSEISFDKTTQLFTIQPTGSKFTIWVRGIYYEINSAQTVTIPNTSGLYYIYFDDLGTLQYKTTYFNFQLEAPVSYVYWNATDGEAYFFADERHGLVLDWQTHEYLHRTRGAAIASGFGANGYTLTGDGSLDADAQISIANGTFFDEDLEVNITHSATPTANTWEQRLQGGAYIPIFRHQNSHWVKDTATQFPMKQGTARAQYNLNTAGDWSSVDMDANKFGISWIVATNNLNEPVIAILGQDSYLTQGEADAAGWESLNLDGFPVFEFRPLYKVVYQTSTGYTNTPHAKITAVYDLRRVISGGEHAIPTTPVSDHGSMTGLGDDDHTQYFNSTRHDLHDHTTVMGTVDLDDIGNVSASSPASGDFLKWNGTAWVNDAIDLGTDTTGNYVSDVTAGTGITITHTTGEGSNPIIAVTANTYQPSLVISDTLPSNPVSGMFWYESDTGRTFVYYDSYWVEIGGQGGPQGPAGSGVGGDSISPFLLMGA